jgi:hypothetical protein
MKNTTKQDDFTKEITDLLNENVDICKLMFHEEFSLRRSHYDNEEETEFKDKLNKKGIDCKAEEHFGGEGEGEDYWTVYSFSKGDEKVLIKFDGWYASYEGSTYEEFYEVKAEPKVITVYNKV